jgi:hypothetical protein
MPDPAKMIRTTNSLDFIDYSTSLFVKQAEARAKELVVERQIISLQHQIEKSELEEEEAILEETKTFARSMLPPTCCARPLCLLQRMLCCVFVVQPGCDHWT